MGAAAGKRLVLPSSPNLGQPFGEFRFKRKTTNEEVAGLRGLEHDVLAVENHQRFGRKCILLEITLERSSARRAPMSRLLSDTHHHRRPLTFRRQ